MKTRAVAAAGDSAVVAKVAGVNAPLVGADGLRDDALEQGPPSGRASGETRIRSSVGERPSRSS